MMMLMAIAALTLTIRLILIGIAITRARRCCITLIVKHNVIGRRWAFQTAAITFQFQIEATLLLCRKITTTSADFVWRSRIWKPDSPEKTKKARIFENFQKWITKKIEKRKRKKICSRWSIWQLDNTNI